MRKLQELKIIHWNCHNLTVSRCFELRDFLKKHEPDIVSLQEIKLKLEDANYLIRFDGFSTYLKVRSLNPDRGGGVAVLINENISHTQIFDFDQNF